MDLQSEETYWSWWQIPDIPILGRLRNKITSSSQLGNVVTPFLRKKSRDRKAKAKNIAETKQCSMITQKN